MGIDLFIQNGNKLYQPLVKDGINWSTKRKNEPGKLTFSIINDGNIDITEGNAVSFKVDGYNVFYGFVFSQKRGKEQHIDIVAYDQLRYLKNKDTYVYSGKRASDLVKILAAKYNLSLGTVENTQFVISSRVEDNATLFDMIGNALDLELRNRKNMYVLYDDFGKLCLRGLESMRTNFLIDEETGENFEYSSSIDDQTYNKIKLSYENDETKKREIYISQDSNNINNWGVLQYFDTLGEGEDGKTKADALLSLYNVKTKKLSISNVFGDCRIRAGSMVGVILNLGDMKVKNYMLVEECKHVFKKDEHFMDLSLRGGDISG